MAEIDWTRFQKSIFINAPMQQIFDAWTIPENITTWFLQKADYTSKDGVVLPKDRPVEEGCEYAWQWWNYDLTEKGRVLRVDRVKHILEFEFAGDNRVKVWVEERGGDHLLRLEQSGISTDDGHKFDVFIGCGQGWSFWMVNLKSWLEHGILLHDQQSRHRTSEFEPQELINR